MPMSPRLLRPIASGIGFPVAEARDGSNNVIAATSYTDANGQAWRAHIFTQSGTLNFTRGGQVEYLVVGGGGGGGRGESTLNLGGGGGGGGGFLTNAGGSPLVIPVGSQVVTVGAGGAGATGSPHTGSDGSSSSLGSLVIATGGGGGGAARNGTSSAGRSGGSGGGAGGNTSGPHLGGSGVSGQGKAGGNYTGQGGAGGGGAGAVGTVGGFAGGTGGAGLASVLSGPSLFYAGGGGGAPPGGGGPIAGGSGGGGAGFGDAVAGGNGTANTGGGGGGTRGTATSFGGNGGSGIVIVRYRSSPPTPTVPWDSDALSYLSAVQSADSAPLEHAVRDAINTFVVGCKSDGIWSAIKASCILMGARTLSGALTPLVGTAPTNNNFVSGDYNRKTGLVGDGTSKFINTNRANNADPQDSQHMAVYLPSAAAAVGTGFASFIAADGGITNGTSVLNYTNSGAGVSADSVVVRSRSANAGSVAGAGPVAGFKGASRSGSASYIVRAAGSNTTITEASQAPTTRNLFVFAQNATAGTTNYNASRIAFYSVGQSLTLSSLDSRVTTLYNAIGAAIP